MNRALVLAVVLIGVVAGVALWGQASPAEATGGPHGEYSATTDSCAGCHRAHTALGSSKLLKDAADVNGRKALATCKSCHDGTGSQLDVVDGLRLDIIGGSANKPAGTTGNNALLIQSATVGTLTAAAEPAARQIAAAAGSSVSYTVHITNGAGTSKNVTVTGANQGNATKFGASATVSPSGATAIAAGATQDFSVTVTVQTGQTLAQGDGNLTQITANDGTNAPLVKVRSRYGAWLLGGGFTYLDGAAVTSSHFDIVGSTGATTATKPWGYAGTDATGGNSRTAYSGTLTASDTDPGQTGVTAAANTITILECTSCHNPHGGSNYRMLRGFNSSEGYLNGYTASVRAWDNSAATYNEGTGASEPARAGLLGDATGSLGKYTETYEKYYSVGSNTFQDGGAGTAANANFASFCGACHTAYPSNAATGGLTAQATTHYRHATEKNYTPRPGGSSQVDPESVGVSGYNLRLATDGTNKYLTCVTCHRAHGTATVMGSYSQAADVATGGGVSGGKSSLLSIDNRGVCQVCHQW